MTRDGSEEMQQKGGRLNPGDQAAPGTPGTGEDLCPECGGDGRIEGRPCPSCGGSGLIIAGIGGG
ncbi:MAG TPA: hypothetical protein VEH84_15410 [Alphaproteobacteria bacterium]|nr:hypothetical protein [Alphaproteobacteria bacterium]